MKEIKLTQGKVALVDDDDYERINQWKWQAKKVKSGAYWNWYAVRDIKKGGKRIHLYMHRVVMGTPKGLTTDHVKSRETLNNQKSNLRVCTQSQNTFNKGMYSTNKSGYKGVSWHKKGGKWVAQITVDGKKIYLGLFENPEEAAVAYDKAALIHHGEYARLNIEVGA